MMFWGSVAVLIIYFFFTRKRNKQTKKINKNICHYYKKDCYFTKKELSFFNDLNEYLKGDLLIFPKVGIKEFVGVKKGLGKEGQEAFLKISQKHIDFLLVNPISFEPVLGIELDGSSHLLNSTMERDLFVNSLYNEIGFELIRFNNLYKKEELPEILDQFINHYRKK